MACPRISGDDIEGRKTSDSWKHCDQPIDTVDSVGLCGLAQGTGAPLPATARPRPRALRRTPASGRSPGPHAARQGMVGQPPPARRWARSRRAAQQLSGSRSRGGCWRHLLARGATGLRPCSAFGGLRAGVIRGELMHRKREQGGRCDRPDGPDRSRPAPSSCSVRQSSGQDDGRWPQGLPSETGR
jgi:hypothetical protein